MGATASGADTGSRVSRTDMATSAEIKAWEKAARANPYVEPTIEEEAAAGIVQHLQERPMVMPPREPWAIRALAWSVDALNKQTLMGLVTALLTWPVRLLLRGIGTRFQPGPLRVWLGGKVGRGEYFQRQMACNQCSTAFVRADAGGRILAGPYCGSCGCGEWFGSTLARKNRYRGWVCPRGKHGTQQPLDTWRDSLPDDMRDRVVLTVNGRQTAKGGCGKGGHAGG